MRPRAAASPRPVRCGVVVEHDVDVVLLRRGVGPCRRYPRSPHGPTHAIDRGDAGVAFSSRLVGQATGKLPSSETALSQSNVTQANRRRRDRYTRGTRVHRGRSRRSRTQGSPRPCARTPDPSHPGPDGGRRTRDSRRRAAPRPLACSLPSPADARAHPVRVGFLRVFQAVVGAVLRVALLVVEMALAGAGGAPRTPFRSRLENGSRLTRNTCPSAKVAPIWLSPHIRLLASNAARWPRR